MATSSDEPPAPARRVAEPGLCAECAHARPVETRHSTLLLCGRAADDPRFLRYPRLPVVSCPGHEPRRR